MNNVTSRDSGFIVLEHDLFQQTVEVATGYILPDALSRSLTCTPVSKCPSPMPILRPTTIKLIPLILDLVRLLLCIHLCHLLTRMSQV